MKRLFFILVILLGLFTNLTAQHISARPPAIQNGANDILYYPFEFDFVDCNGDIIQITGTEMLVRHLPPNMSDGHNKMNLILQDGEGINQRTGERYHVLQQLSLIVKISNSSTYTLITAIQHWHLVGEKTGTSIRLSQLTHNVFHPNGTWELVAEQASSKCDGEPTTVQHY